MPIDVDGLVQVDKGLVSRRIFVEEEIYEQELEKIFSRCWLYLAHETQISKPGDYLATYMGEDPVVLWKDKAGHVRAFLNSCRHRGMKLCRGEEGNANSLTCPYHGWTYNNEGKLVVVPGYTEGYFEGLTMEQWGLVPIRVEAYKGLIFGTFDEGMESLENYLGDMKWYLDMMVDRTDEGLEVLPGVHRWTIYANWKFAAENFLGDFYHFLPTHKSIIQLGFGLLPPTPKLESSISFDKGHGMCIDVFKVGAGGQVVRDKNAHENIAYAQYLLDAYNEIERRLGKERAQYLPCVLNGTVFPNFSFINQIAYLSFRVWHPRGPTKMEMSAWCLVDKGMPKEFKEMACRAYLHRLGPAGVIEQDDVEIWNQCTDTARGRVTKRHPLNYQMGLRSEETHKTLPGHTGPLLSDLNQRGFYRYWAQLMKENGRGKLL